ncbi:enoyl-CoA hydratase/isomerase family protein [Paraburkholderia guartelaensis]|uniref:Enoyl-CoA hydratase/isomerase family protein n=1 Tax=Paraburkholderia guartelaensis TaxID=2546446 RepID=A0A4R5L5U5_9BURK|nr:enoyl-CoA hydratase/isomerase family protein [Paraburkholderia guartelaensis]TDG03958.1 enoyl-CoA hydratase/isomerase family protein [Paraburkholderia guartelaensis]
MTYQTLNIRRDGRTLFVDFNNPPLNLINAQMIGELFDLAGSLAFDRETAVVVFGSANPEFFVAHFDLNDLLRLSSDPTAPRSRYDDINVLQALSTVWQTLPQVTIGVVDGICRGAGLEFILAFDMRFATPGSRFCLPEASGGILPAGGGTTRLAMLIGPARAREVILSARDFSGDEAATYGFVNRTLPRENLHTYVSTLAHGVAKRPPSSIAAVDEVIKSVFGWAVDAQFAGFASENAAFMKLVDEPPVREGLEKMAQMQDVEHERDLPALLAAAE